MRSRSYRANWPWPDGPISRCAPGACRSIWPWPDGSMARCPPEPVGPSGHGQMARWPDASPDPFGHLAMARWPDGQMRARSPAGHLSMANYAGVAWVCSPTRRLPPPGSAAGQPIRQKKGPAFSGVAPSRGNGVSRHLPRRPPRRARWGDVVTFLPSARRGGKPWPNHFWQHLSSRIAVLTALLPRIVCTTVQLSIAHHLQPFVNNCTFCNTSSL